MTVTVPSFDAQGTYLQGTINDINTLIAANPNDLALGTQLYAAQQALCLYLISNGNLAASSILTNETYIGAP